MAGQDFFLAAHRPGPFLISIAAWPWCCGTHRALVPWFVMEVVGWRLWVWDGGRLRSAL